MDGIPVNVIIVHCCTLKRCPALPHLCQSDLLQNEERFESWVLSFEKAGNFSKEILNVHRIPSYFILPSMVGHVQDLSWRGSTPCSSVKLDLHDMKGVRGPRS